MRNTARFSQLMQKLCSLLMLVSLAACAPPFPRDARLDAELAERSKNEGLAILTTYVKPMPVTYFDGTYDRIDCGGRASQVWAVPGGTQLIGLDNSPPLALLKKLTSDTAGQPKFAAELLSSLTPNLALFNLDGRELRRFGNWISAPYMAVSRDGTMIAFRGQGGVAPSNGHSHQDKGFLVGPIDATSFTVIELLPDPSARTPDSVEEILGWSPDGSDLTYGRDGAIYAYNLRQHVTRDLAKGSNPQWSPDGERISYRGPNGEAMLVDSGTKRTQQLMTGHLIDYALRWSPDGRYLFLTLVTDAWSSTWAKRAIYRVSDGTLTSFGNAGPITSDKRTEDWILMPKRVKRSE